MSPAEKWLLAAAGFTFAALWPPDYRIGLVVLLFAAACLRQSRLADR